MKDYYHAANNALSPGKFSDACGWLHQLLRLSSVQGETWFNSAAWFLLSYAQMSLGALDEAEKSLDRAISYDSECALPLPVGTWDHNTLRKEIQLRKINR